MHLLEFALAASLAACSVSDSAPAKRTQKQEPDSWWVADQNLTKCMQTENPYKVSEQMRNEGKQTKVSESWQYKGRYDINWQDGDRFMERNIYGSKSACEYDQQISRR